jgi:lipoprotein NlpD
MRPSFIIGFSAVLLSLSLSATVASAADGVRMLTMDQLTQPAPSSRSSVTKLQRNPFDSSSIHASRRTRKATDAPDANIARRCVAGDEMNAGKSSRAVPAGWYRVNRGDTLSGIGVAFGRSPQDIGNWNCLATRAPIHAGQLLRVAPPRHGTLAAKAETRPTTRTGAASRQAGFAWPAYGSIAQPYVAGQSTGVTISGAAGDPVTAFADGKVVFVGSGNSALIAVRHRGGMVSTYSHVAHPLVEDNEAVKRGQAIGKMGDAGALEFELRRDGKPVNPLDWLPIRGG